MWLAHASDLSLVSRFQKRGKADPGGPPFLAAPALHGRERRTASAYCLRETAACASPIVLTTVLAMLESRLNCCASTWKLVRVLGSSLSTRPAASESAWATSSSCAFRPSTRAASQLLAAWAPSPLSRARCRPSVAIPL